MIRATDDEVVEAAIRETTRKVWDGDPPEIVSIDDAHDLLAFLLSPEGKRFIEGGRSIFD